MLVIKKTYLSAKALQCKQPKLCQLIKSEIVFPLLLYLVTRRVNGKQVICGYAEHVCTYFFGFFLALFSGERSSHVNVHA